MRGKFEKVMMRIPENLSKYPETAPECEKRRKGAWKEDRGKCDTPQVLHS